MGLAPVIGLMGKPGHGFLGSVNGLVKAFQAAQVEGCRIIEPSLLVIVDAHFMDKVHPFFSPPVPGIEFV